MRQQVLKSKRKWTLALAALGIISGSNLVSVAKADSFVNPYGGSSSGSSNNGSSSSGGSCKGSGKGGAGQTGSTQSQSDEISMIEGAIGRKLTDQERTDIQAAMKARDEALASAKSTFLSSVSSTTGVSTSDLQSKTKGGGNIIRQVSKLTSSTLTDAQVSSIKSAESTESSAMKKALDTYKAAVAKALDMTVEELDKLMDAYLSKKTGQSGLRGKCGSGSGSGSNGTTTTTTTTSGYN